MLISTGNCCCNPPFWLYAGTRGATAQPIYRINPEDQTISSFYSGLTNRCYDLACDPTTGNLYIAAGTQGAVCIDSNGNHVWTNSVGVGLGSLLGIAVSKNGFVYTGFNNTIRKLDAATGVEVTTGGWPYTHGASVGIRCICVDQSENVYVGGGGQIVTAPIRVLSINSSATLRWTSNCSNSVPAETPSAAALGCYGIAVNEGGTQLVCSRFVGGAPTTIHSHYHLNASTGARTGSFRDGSTQNSGIQSGGAGQNCEYGPLGTSYSTQFPDTAPNRETVLTNIAPYYAFPQIGSNVYTANDITISRTGDEYVVDNYPDGEVHSLLDGWYIVVPGSGGASSIEISQGRIGAFGL